MPISSLFLLSIFLQYPMCVCVCGVCTYVWNAHSIGEESKDERKSRITGWAVLIHNLNHWLDYYVLIDRAAVVVGHYSSLPFVLLTSTVFTMTRARSCLSCKQSSLVSFACPSPDICNTTLNLLQVVSLDRLGYCCNLPISSAFTCDSTQNHFTSLSPDYC